MVKVVENQKVVDMLKKKVSTYATQLSSCIDKTAMMRAYQTRRRSERLYAYHSILRDACCQCFRGTGISADGKKCVVWGFDGRKWSEVASVVFADAVGEALIKCSGAGDFVVKGDWVEKKSLLLQSAYAGVCMSPLGVNSAVVGFSNGVWDFTDIDNPVYHPFSDRLPVTELLPYEFDASAGCPLWESFLRMMLKPLDILKLQKYLGLGCVNRRLLPHVVEDTLWLVGSGANGKTTIENVVRGVYGYDKVSEASMGELLDRNQVTRMLTIAGIEGKMFNICSEVDVADMTRGSDAFKKLCSGEPQMARSIGKDVHVVYDIPFLIFSMNQKPSNKRMDAAFRRRIVEINFNVSVRPEDVDTGLGEKLRKELPGIRNWMIEGYKRLVKDKYLFDHTSDEEFREMNGQFFDIFIDKERIRPSAWAGKNELPQLVYATTLYERFADFCEKNMYGVEPPSRKSMGQDLRRLNFKFVRKASGVYYEVYSDKDLNYAIK